MKSLVILFLISPICFVGCEAKTHEIYTSNSLGLQLEIPSDWDVEEPERVLSLIISPARGKGSHLVSITIVPNLNIERDLTEALEDEVHRLKTKWSIDEITVVVPAEESALNGFNIAKITIEAPVQSQIEERTNDYSSFQPMDILILDTGDRFIEIYFRKSTINPDLNDEGQNIIDSIEAFP